MLARLSPTELCLAVAMVTAAIEMVTVVLRFGFRLRSETHTRWLARLTAGHRIHHSYVGVAIMGASLFIDRASDLHHICVITGAGLGLSDLVHHYLVLWPLTGRSEFRVRYPESEVGPAAAE